MEVLKFINQFKNSIVKNKLKLIALIVVCLIPMIYGFIFLSAFFDPYGLMPKLPIAVVNLDKGAKKENKTVNFGKDIIKNLKNNHRIHWEFVNLNTASNGINGEKYYSIIIIPEDFSEKLMNISTGKINKAHITYQCNEKKNFIAVQISTKIMDDFMKTTTKAISKESSKVVVDSLFQVKDGLKAASEGSTQIYTGAIKLKSGSEKITNGLGNAEDGSNLLSSGLKNAASGGTELSKGMDSLINGLTQFSSELSKKDNRITELVDGAEQLSIGITTAKDGSIKLNNGLSEGLSDAAEGVVKLSEAINEADYNLQLALAPVLQSNLTDAQKQNIIYAAAVVSSIKEKNLNNTLAEPLKKAATSASPLVEGLNKLEAGGKSVSNGTKQLTNGIEAKQIVASEGMSKLLTGANEIKTGVDKLSVGLNAASEKANDLSGGLSKLYNGSATLSSSLSNLVDGSKKLKSGLDSGYDQINSKLTFKPEAMSEFISEPVQLKNIRLNPVNYYGEGFAPYFIPLALWVGCLVMFTLLDEDIKKYAEVSSPQQFVGKTIFLGVLAAIQSLLLSSILIIILKLQVTNLLIFFSFNILLGITYAVIFNSLIYLLGDVGRLILFLMLVLQLTSCGGTFPPELIPSFFNKISPFLPMTYCTAALREIISGSNSSIISYNLLILVSFGSGSAAICLTIKSIFAEKNISIFSKEQLK